MQIRDQPSSLGGRNDSICSHDTPKKFLEVPRKNSRKLDNLFETSLLEFDKKAPVPIAAHCEGGGTENMLNNLDFDHIDVSKNFDFADDFGDKTPHG